MFRRLARSIKQFLTAIVLLLLAIVAVEVVLQLQQPPVAATISPQTPADLQSWLAPSATVHHEMRRLNSPEANEYGLPFATNSLGLRGTEPVSPKPAGTLRIVMLGDETVVGRNLPDAHTVTARLTEFLTTATGRTVEVVNAGVPGYCPLLSWLQFQHELERLSPDIVILHFDMTDVADDSCYRRRLKQNNDRQICVNPLLSRNQRAPTSLNGILKNSALLRMLQAETGLLPKTLEDSEEFRGRYEWTRAVRSDLRLQIQHSLDPLNRFADAAKQLGFRLLISTSPSPWQVTTVDAFPELSKRIATGIAWPDTGDVPYQILDAACQKTQVSFCNPTNAFRSFSQTDGLYQENSPSLSAYGAALYAREIASVLLQTPEFASVFSKSSNISAEPTHLN